MVDKRKLHHWQSLIRRVKTWQLLLVFVIVFGLSLYLLRQNNLGMVELRNLVKQADEENGNTGVALTNLQHYVNSHMNTNLGAGVFLEHAYQRAYDAALKEAANTVNPNSAVYIQAEDQCRQEFGARSFQQYLQCVQQKVMALTPGRDPLENVKVPPAELFRYNFVSPIWSLDAAGIVVLITAFIGSIIIIRTLGYIALALLLRRHK